MTDDDTNKYGSDEAADAADRAAEGGDAGMENFSEQAENDLIEQLRAENNDLKDRFLRTVAEMENLRRRTERDVKDARSYSIAGFARDMLAVSDNLRRAIDAVPEGGARHGG